MANKKEYIKNYHKQDEVKDKRKIHDNSPIANKLNLLNRNIRSNSKILDELLNEINSTKETIHSNGESKELLKLLDKLLSKEKSVLDKLEKYKQELVVTKQNKSLAKFDESVKDVITNLSATPSEHQSDYSNIMESLDYNMIFDEIYSNDYIPKQHRYQHVKLE